MTLLELPAEVRLIIYAYLFRGRKVILDGSRQVEPPSLVPGTTTQAGNWQHLQPCSAQLLRVCKLILYEAQPLLYQNTVFQTDTQVFAAKHPVVFAAGCPTAKLIRHLTWNLRCDMMKHLYPEEFKITKTDLQNLNSLEIRCQVENWRTPLYGEWCDEEIVERGREQMLEYARLLQSKMEDNPQNQIMLVEDKTYLRRGRIVLRLTREMPRWTQSISKIPKPNSYIFPMVNTPQATPVL